MPIKEKSGVVISNKMEKTIVVSIENRVTHKKYGKVITKTKKYKAHNTELVFNVGDEVKIIECKPISKTKLWQLAEITKKAT